MRPSNPTGVEEVRYRPLRKRGALPALWIFFSLTMIFAFYFEWQQMLPAQLALGLDPIACAELFVVASVSQIALVGILFASAYRAVVSQGSIAVVGDRVEGDLAGRRFSFPSASLRNIAAGIGGTNIRLRFEEILLRLPGLWMPDGWKWRLFRLRSPEGKSWSPRRKQHPLLLTLLRLRPDLMIHRQFAWGSLLSALLLGLSVNLFEVQLYLDARESLRLHQKEEAVLADLRAGRYRAACSGYESLIPEARHQLYLAENAADMQVYCGNLKLALRAALDYDIQPLWPVAMDKSTLARIRLAQRRYEEAERLLQGDRFGNYILYLALAKQGRADEANGILGQDRRPSGRVGVFDKALLLRRTGRLPESRAEAEIMWSACKFRPSIPRWLSRPILVAVLTEKPGRIAAAVAMLGSAFRDLPGFRNEVFDFVEREAREELPSLQEAIEKVHSTDHQPLK